MSLLQSAGRKHRLEGIGLKGQANSDARDGGCEERRRRAAAQNLEGDRGIEQKGKRIAVKKSRRENEKSGSLFGEGAFWQKIKQKRARVQKRGETKSPV